MFSVFLNIVCIYCVLRWEQVSAVTGRGVAALFTSLFAEVMHTVKGLPDDLKQAASVMASQQGATLKEHNI